jgi:glycosyltransferase involved in cell wall biosynthesis
MKDWHALSVLQISTADAGGGGEKVAYDLHSAYRACGLAAWLAVGSKRTNDPLVAKMDSEAYRGGWARLWVRLSYLIAPPADDSSRAAWLRRRIQLLGQPRRLLDVERGREDFDFPATWRLMDLAPDRPDVIHGHNLHGSYFDLRALPWLSHEAPLVLTLHDAWLLSGHCAHSFACERWRIGCGLCPDLTIYPSVRRDATAWNFRRKRKIYAASRLYIASPSHWLMDRVSQSMLMDGEVDSRVIPNGVNLSVFRPADRPIVRAELGLRQDARVLLFVANGIRQNIWKDYRTLRAAIALVAERLPGMPILFLALGEDSAAERIGAAEIRFVPYQNASAKVAQHFQAADLYVHAARVDTFPTTVLESLACGTPVVATAVGGIPEQVKSLDSRFGGATCGPGEATGLLTPSDDAESLAAGIVTLLDNDDLRCTLGVNAEVDARLRFDLDRQANDYLSWYDECLDAHRRVVEK